MQPSTILLITHSLMGFFRCWCLLFPLDTHLDLHQEVPQVLFEGGDVLIQAEQTRHKHVHLGTEENTSSYIYFI